MIFEWIMLGFCSCLIVVSLCCIAWYVIPVFMEWSPKKKSIMQDERYKANTGKKLGDFGKIGEHIMSVRSDQGEEWYEIRKEDDKVTCTCIGFVTKKRCKHTRRYVTMMAVEQVYKRWIK